MKGLLIFTKIWLQLTITPQRQSNRRVEGGPLSTIFQFYRGDCIWR